MCKYCQHLETGDEFEDLLQIPIVHGIGSFVKNEEDQYRDEIDICIEGEELAVYVWLGGDCEHVAGLPIKYCPVCGQDLSYLISRNDGI